MSWNTAPLKFLSAATPCLLTQIIAIIFLLVCFSMLALSQQWVGEWGMMGWILPGSKMDRGNI